MTAEVYFIPVNPGMRFRSFQAKYGSVANKSKNVLKSSYINQKLETV